MMDGFIKLDRDFLDWGWYSDINTKTVFLHLMLTATHKPIRYKGTQLTTGQVASTVAEIAEKTGLSVRQTRTAIEHLKSTNDIAVQSTNKFSVFTVISLQKQGPEKPERQAERQVTDKQKPEKRQTHRTRRDRDDDYHPDSYKLADSSRGISGSVTMMMTPPVLQAKCTAAFGALGPGAMTDLETACAKLGIETTQVIVDACLAQAPQHWGYIHKALANAASQGIRSPADYVGRYRRTAGTVVDRPEPSGTDYLRRGQHRPLRLKVGGCG